MLPSGPLRPARPAPGNPRLGRRPPGEFPAITARRFMLAIAGRLIQLALERLLAGRTAFIIAQRLSTIRKADVVIVLEEGRIADLARRSDGRSPHSQLLDTSSIYADIYNGQLRPQAINGNGSGADEEGSLQERRS